MDRADLAFDAGPARARWADVPMTPMSEVLGRTARPAAASP
jgi:hypothetical protein